MCPQSHEAMAEPSSVSAFTQLIDRGIAAEGTLAKWCPTMDLIALATSDGQLHVHRLNWQRLWWTSPDAPITALDWSPDGKQLAVGLEDGTVLLLNTEDGEVQHKKQLRPGCALLAIAWTEASAGPDSGRTAGVESAPLASSQLVGDRARRMFAPPPSPVPSAAAGLKLGYGMLGKQSSGSQPWPPELPHLALLACATAAGEVLLCTSQLFSIAHIQLSSLLGCQSIQVLRLAMDAHLTRVAICWRDSGAAPDDHDAALRLSVIDIGHIGQNASQWHQLAVQAGHVVALLESCTASFWAAASDWQAGMRELEDSRARLMSLIRDHAGGGDPASELRDLLVRGAMSGALQQYISSTLGEAGLRKLARAVDAAACSLHNTLTDHLQPLLEQLAFRLAELRGLALCQPWKRITGLQAHQVAATERVALRLVLQAEAVRRQVVEAGAQYRTFFAWLLTVLHRLQEDASDVLLGYPRSHLERVHDFLAGQYERDAVAPLLGQQQDGELLGEDLSPSLEHQATTAALGPGLGSGEEGMLGLIWEVLGPPAAVQAECTAGGPCRVDSGAGGTNTGVPSTGSSVGQLLGRLSALCQAAFQQTELVTSPTLTLHATLALGPPPSALACTFLPGHPGAITAVAWQGRPEVLLLRGAGCSRGDSSAEQALEAAVVQLPSGEAAADLGFYREAQLALLLGPAPGGGGAQAARLQLLPQDRLQFVSLPAELLHDCTALQLCPLLAESSGSSAGGQPLPDDCRQRRLGYARVQPPLAVSVPRGVGCALAGTQRVLLFDLEEDEEDGDEGQEHDPHAQGLDDGVYSTPPRE